MSKVIVVTGSSAGIGLALCRFFYKKQYKVYGISRSGIEGEPYPQIKADVSSLEIKKIIEEIIDKEKRIDILINNAGIGIVSSIEDFSREEYNKLMDTNVWGTINLIQAILPYMRAQNKGQIINISSIAANHGLPFRGFYSASKSAVNKITEALRTEILDTDVQACSLNLGGVNTEIAKRRIYSKTSLPYIEKFEKVNKYLESEISKGKNVIDVVHYIDHLLTKKKWPAVVYYGNTMEKLSVLLKKVANPLWFEKNIAKHTGL